MKFLKALILLSVLLSFSASALLEVNIIKSKEELFPVVIAPFEVIGDAHQGADIANIIKDNLNRSGQFNALGTNELVTNQIDFNFWQEHKKDAVILERLNKSVLRFSISISIFMMYSPKRVFMLKRLQFTIVALGELHIT